MLHAPWRPDDAGHLGRLPAILTQRSSSVFRATFSLEGMRNILHFDSSQDSKPRENGVPHGSVVGSSKRETQTGTDSLRHILVVDDDPMVCVAIEIYIQRNGFRVTIAGDGESGLRARERPDLMIIDIFMPPMHGFESVRLFHDSAPTIPLIAMSGYAFADINSPAPDFLRMALELGAARCLRKPITPAALTAVIKECLSESDSASLATNAKRLG